MACDMAPGRVPAVLLAERRSSRERGDICLVGQSKQTKSSTSPMDARQAQIPDLGHACVFCLFSFGRTLPFCLPPRCIGSFGALHYNQDSAIQTSVLIILCWTCPRTVYLSLSLRLGTLPVSTVRAAGLLSILCFPFVPTCTTGARQFVYHRHPFPLGVP